jgi:very-short-patch-repair endonuclease
VYFILISLSLFVLLLGLVTAFGRRQQFFARPVMTPFERGMYQRLKQAFPEHHILAQVAFSALITHHHYKIRSKFNRKVTDFVLLDQQCQVVAVIELDDPSHLHRQQDDALRDDMLQQAGYQVYRYQQIPAIATLKRDIRCH